MAERSHRTGWGGGGFLRPPPGVPPPPPASRRSLAVSSHCCVVEALCEAPFFVFVVCAFGTRRAAMTPRWVGAVFYPFPVL